MAPLLVEVTFAEHLLVGHAEADRIGGQQVKIDMDAGGRPARKDQKLSS